MKRSYAVVWSDNGAVDPGRLDLLRHSFELHGRRRRISVPFTEVVGASIARKARDRLHGLPVLELTRRTGPLLRIASLEGAGALHELAARLGEAQTGT
jgi:hypothetical protein